MGYWTESFRGWLLGVSASFAAGDFRRIAIALLWCMYSFGIALAESPAEDNSPPLRWWKGNLHTHSLWSDGDDFPEMIASWYREHDYNFLALSDHNILSSGQRWMAYEKIVQRSNEQVLDKYRTKFGDAWVETRGEPGSDAFEVRLKPLDEFRCLVEQAGEFIMIQGEEISDRAEGKPVHMNATNLRELIRPVGGETVREAMQNNLRLVLEQEKETGREILPHLNHPNFGYAITAEDLAVVVRERFFEVYNGHPGVNHLGNDQSPSVERIWDIANTIRLTRLNAEPLFGVATDDSHEYHGLPGSHTGRGWVMVRARYLTPEHLIKAMKAGDFYASSGVTLGEVGFDAKSRTLSLRVDAQADANYRIDFIASMKDADSDSGAEEEIGKVVHSVEGVQAEYTLNGDELYVRAVVTSDRPHPDPSFEDQFTQAWTQPVGWRVEP